jgi:hypothetical protein
MTGESDKLIEVAAALTVAAQNSGDQRIIALMEKAVSELITGGLVPTLLLRYHHLLQLEQATDSMPAIPSLADIGE